VSVSLRERLYGLALGVGVVVAGASAEVSAPASRYYLERRAGAVGPRTAAPGDDVPSAVTRLAALLRDGRVPGFYDGQFAALRGDLDELARLAADTAVHHVIRVMAVMAIQEVADGEAVAHVLEPLLAPPEFEYDIEYQEHVNAGGWSDDEWIAQWQAAELSRYARFALGKDGQPAAVLAKIRELELHATKDLARTLDPTIDDDTSFDHQVSWRRELHFSIGYLYQQLDDYENAGRWFRRLTRNLAGHRITQMAHYNLACIEALCGRPGTAVAELERAFAVGFTDVSWMDEDGDLSSLRERADFQELRARMLGVEQARSVQPPVRK